MSQVTYPLGMPEELLKKSKENAAKDTGLSVADVMRQSNQIWRSPECVSPCPREEDMSEAMADTWEKLGPAPRVKL